MTTPPVEPAAGADPGGEVTGERVVRIAAGAYAATISEIGAALVSLTHGDRPLVYAAADTVPEPRFRGAVLFPWPNRIADGRYHFDGRTHQLPINETARNTALHGLAAYHSWTVVDLSPDAVSWETTIWPQPGYPFTVAVRADYALSAEAGLHIAVTVRNIGADPAPYGVSIHPYLSAGAGGVDDWTFQTSAHSVVAVDDQRLLPTATVPVDGTPFDFRAPAPLAGRLIDHALTGFDFGDAGYARATLLDGDGYGVRMTWREACPWLQVHTTDLPGQRLHRRGLAVEPMTCPPDAFNSGQGLIRLEVGERRTTRWWIAAVVVEGRGQRG